MMVYTMIFIYTIFVHNILYHMVYHIVYDINGICHYISHSGISHDISHYGISHDISHGINIEF
jgi:hypothetical protein